MAKFEDGQRFVITGVGMVSPIGNDPETAWRSLLRAEHGVEYARDSLFVGYETLPIYVAAPVKEFDLTKDASFAGHYKEIRAKWDLSQQFVLWAGSQALRQAGVIPEDSLKIDENVVDPDRVGVLIGTGVGGANGLADARFVIEREKIEYAQALEDDDQEKLARMLDSTRLNSKLILKSLPGRVAGTPSIVFGAKAFWKGILQECASGNGAIISAIEALKLGKADVVLAGGVEGEISPTTTALFGAARAVSRNHDPETASRPLDQDRDGLIMGQGAGTMVVETMQHALNRGAPILAEIVGYAENADAKDETEPDPVNVTRCIQSALGMMDRPVSKLRNGNINGHMTSTPIGDQAEMLAISSVFEPHQLSSISAVKAATGHTFGASGSIEAIFSVLGLRDNLAPPIHNLHNPIEEAKGYTHLMSQSEPIEADMAFSVNQSFGFGGNNAVIVLQKPR